MGTLHVQLDGGSSQSVSELEWVSTAMVPRQRLVSLTVSGWAEGYKNSQAVDAAIAADTTNFPLTLNGMTRGTIKVKANENPNVDGATNGHHEFEVQYAAASSVLTAGEMSYGTSTVSGSAKIINAREQKLRVVADDKSEAVDHGVNINVTADSIEGTTVQVSATQVDVQMVLASGSSFDAGDVEALIDTVNTNAFEIRHARTGRLLEVEAYAALMKSVSVPDQTNASGDTLVNCSMLIKDNYPTGVTHPEFTTTTPTSNKLIMHAHDVLWFYGRHSQTSSTTPVQMQVTSAYIDRVYTETSWNTVFGTAT